MWVAAWAIAAFVALTGGAQASELLGVCGDKNLCAASEKGRITVLTKDGSAAAPYASPSMSLDGQAVGYVRAGAPYLGGQRGKGAEKLLDTPDTDHIRLSDDGRSFTFDKFSVIFNGSFQFEFALFVGGDIGSRRYSSTSQVLGGSFLGDKLMLGTTFNNQVDDEICTVALVPSTEPPPCGTLVATQPGRSIERASASPDGSLIAAESNVRDPDTAKLRSSAIALFNPRTGQLVRELTAGPMDTRPEFSPDGKRVSFTRGADTWVVPVSGGAPRVLVRNFTDADWAGPTGTAVPARSVLKLAGRTITAIAKCSAQTGCNAATWQLKEKGEKKPFAQFRIPALKNGGAQKVKTQISRSKARRVNGAAPKGLKFTLTGAGAPRKVVVRGS